MKIKFTKGELKKQRDALGQYQRYLPTLQLKKQQLQIEILHQTAILREKTRQQTVKKEAARGWAGLLAEPIDIRPWIKPCEVSTGITNIAGVDVVVFQGLEFGRLEYDLFLFPLWVDLAIEYLRQIAALGEEIRILEEGIVVLKQQLRITTQRVNLFEKIRIPQAKEVIRRIKIYIGDQTANSVGRSKIAKRKIETLALPGVA